MNKDFRLPQGWRWVQFGDIIRENRKSKIKVEEADNSGDYPFFTSGDKILTHSEFYVDGENLFISTGGTAYIRYFLGKASYSADTYSVKIREDIYTKLVYYLLEQSKEQISFRYFIGSGLEHLQKDEFKKKFKIIIPDILSEQQKIAEILETVDNAIDKTDKLIEKYKRIKQGLMQELLTKGIDEKGNIRNEKTHKFKDSPLGRIPQDWEVVRLGEVIKLNPQRVEYKKNKTIYYIDIDSVKNGKIEGIKIFKIEDAPSRAQRLIKNKDVIVSTVRPNLKAFALIESKYDGFICSTGFAVLRPMDNILSSFLYQLILHDDIFLKQVSWLVIGSNYPAVNPHELLYIIIPLPPLPEQEKIAEILSQIDAVIEKEEKYKGKLERIKKGLMKDLLTGKIRVNN